MNERAPHMGDCPIAEHQGPITCDRCVCDEFRADARAVLEALRRERNNLGKYAMPQTLEVITDLTTRLRESSALYIEAANEIERLRTALIVAREFALWPACAAELQRVLSSIDEVLS